MSGFLHKKVTGISQERKMLQAGTLLSKEEGDVLREFKAMHEENCLGSWLREDGRDKNERKLEVDKETNEEMGKKMIREEEKEVNETVIVKEGVSILFRLTP